jgi:hypothetical protein
MNASWKDNPLVEMIALHICKYWRSAKPCFSPFASHPSNLVVDRIFVA